MDAADGSPAYTIAVVVVIDEQHDGMVVCNLVILIDDAVIDTLLA